MTPITLSELLVAPVQEGHHDLAQRYLSTLSSGTGFSMAELSGRVCLHAAVLHSRYAFKRPDALQCAASQIHGCFALVTHDQAFLRVDELNVFMGD